MPRLANILARANKHFGAWFIRIVIIGILSLLFFVTGGGISQNDKWKIDKIKVSGASVVSSEAIMALAREKLIGNYYFVYARGNSYLFPRHELEAALLDVFPRLASVRAERADAHTVAITVNERSPFALWCGEAYLQETRELNNCWFIDDTGFVFDRAPVFSKGVYLEIYGGIANVQNNDILRRTIVHNRFVPAYNFERAIKKEVGIPIRIIIKPDGEYATIVRSSTHYPILKDVEIRFNDGQDAKTLVNNLLAALPVQFPAGVEPKKKLLYIDLRFDNKVIFGNEN